MSKPGRYLKPAERTLTQQVSGTVVLLNPDNGEYYALDEVGSRVWELCDGVRSLADVVSVICGEYDAPRRWSKRTCWSWSRT